MEPSPRPLARRRPDLAVAPGDLRLTCDASAFAFSSTAEVEPVQETIGQERAVEALELGLALRSPGYDVYVSGRPGTGRTSTVTGLLQRLAPTLPRPPDRAFVHRLDDPDRPRLLSLPAGGGRVLARQMDELRNALRARVPRLVEDPELDRRREAIRRRYAREEDERMAALAAELQADGFTLVHVAVAGGLMVPEVAPVRDGRPVPLDELAGELPPERLADMRARLEAHEQRVREHLHEHRRRERSFERELRDMVREAASALVDDELVGAGGDAPPAAVAEFVDDVRRDAVAAVVEVAGPGPGTFEGFLRRIERYRVNLLVDRSGLEGAPVVQESYPTRQNLAGSIERVQDGPPFAWRADATTIRGGSLLRADGGFLVVQATDLLGEPGAWDVLKRTIKNGRLELGGSESGLLGLPRSLQPDPVPVDVKLVLVGERWVHDLLYAADPDFRKLVGVRADFSEDVPMSPEVAARYAEVISAVCRTEDLPPVDADGVAALVEDGITRAGRRNRISAEFARMANLLREAAFLARRRDAAGVGREDVEEALRRREFREGAIPERLQELLEEGVLLVATSGREVGQVNGLSVYDLGYHSFGKPTRITASAAPGRAGIINIEREARLSGGIYDKGVLTIGGFLRRRYADLGPLSLTASLTFEQSYAGVDGDSASIAEVVALVSELSGMPVDQAVALTGSINQHGEVQPVGGVNEKLRAFHALCRSTGLDGTHGTVLPTQNVDDLMLPRAMVEDVAAGRFHVFAVRRVEDALEIALDAPIAAIDEAVRARLEEYAVSLARRGGEEAEPTGAGLGAGATELPPAAESGSP